MAFYVVEEDVWKCPKHPSRRRRSGICPICLRDRLITLCPHCANVRPCECRSVTTSSSSSSSSSFSLFSSVDGESSFRRSRSVAIPFLRSRFSGDSDAENRSKSSNWSVFKQQSKSKKGEEKREDEELEKRGIVENDDYANRMMVRSRFAGDFKHTLPRNRIKSSIWSVFNTQSKNNKGEEERADEELAKREIEENNVYSNRMMMRSRSVSVPVTSNSVAGDGRSSSAKGKGKGWYFKSPIKAFRHSKNSKLVHERSPLHRG